MFYLDSIAIDIPCKGFVYTFNENFSTRSTLPLFVVIGDKFSGNLLKDI